MEIVGEILQMDTDSQIHQHFKQHWQTWFPYPNFAKQCVNFTTGKTLIQQHSVKQHGQDNIHFIDGFPIPVCHIIGIKPKHSYCASKQQKYFGFEGHLLIIYRA